MIYSLMGSFDVRNYITRFGVTDAYCQGSEPFKRSMKGVWSDLSLILDSMCVIEMLIVKAKYRALISYW